MQTNLLEIEEILSNWYLLTAENPLYAGALALVVWLLAMVFYNIKILFLKKRQKASDIANAELQSQLENAEQQVKRSAEQLAVNAEQMEKDQQWAAEFGASVGERNQKIVADIKALAKQFNLSEQLITSDKDMKAEFIWQQQDNILMQLTESLVAEQQEKKALLAAHEQEMAQITEKESLIGTLQTTLDMQTKQFAQLEQSFEAQKALQQQQQQEVQEQLTRTLAKHQIDFSQLIEDLKKQPQVTPVESTQNNEGTAVDDASQQDDAVIATDKTEAQANEPEPAVVSEDETVAVEETSAGQRFMNLGAPQQAAVSTEEASLEQDIKLPEAEAEAEADDTSSMSHEPEAVIDQPKETIHTFNMESAQLPETEEERATEPSYTESNIKVPGKIKSLLGKFKKTTTKVEPEQRVEAVKIEEPEQEESIDVELESEPESKPDYLASNVKIPAKVKNLFGKFSKK